MLGRSKQLVILGSDNYGRFSRYLSTGARPEKADTLREDAHEHLDHEQFSAFQQPVVHEVIAANTQLMASRPDLKVDDEAGFIKFFRNLPAKDSETVRIFDRGDWYTAHGDDATFIARTVSYNDDVGPEHTI